VCSSSCSCVFQPSEASSPQQAKAVGEGTGKANSFTKPTVARQSNKKNQNVSLDNSLPSCKETPNASKNNELKIALPDPQGEPFKFNHFFQPGIYAIFNTENEKYYIGEANNLAQRLSEHYENLKNRRHDCAELKEDWNLHGAAKFEFIILEIGFDPYSERVKRLQSQGEYIRKYRNNTYNRIGLNETPKVLQTTNQQHNSIKVLAYDVTYKSVSAAARANGICLSTARNRLNDPNDLNWRFAENLRRAVSNVARPVVVDNTYYASVSIAAAANGVSEKTVRKNIREKANWNNFDTLTPEEKEKIPNLNALINESGSFLHGRRVQVRNEIFPSIKKAAQAFNIDPRTVRKRINSTNFPDWKWAD